MVKKRWWRIYKCFKKFNFFFIQVFKKEVILLIDKYDAPLINAYEHGYYDEAILFLKYFMEKHWKLISI